MENWERIQGLIETELSAILGTYEIRTSNGTIAKPAIWVFPPQPQSDRTVTGLEVIIQKTPETKRTWLFRSSKNTKQFSIRLIHHDSAGNLEEAVDLLVESLPKLQGFKGVEQQILPQSDIADEQAIVTLSLLERV